MKITKRNLILGLLIINFGLLFGLIFFGNFSSNRDSSTGPVVISFWHSMADSAGLAFDEYVREFNEGPGKENNIFVQAVFQGQYADAVAKLRPLLQSRHANALPDVMQIDATGIVDFLNTEYAYTVDDALLNDQSFDLSSIMEAPLKAWNYNNRQLGLPVSASTTVMYYNKSILDAAGITSPPTSFGEIIEISRRLPLHNSNNQRLTAYAQQPNTPTLANWIGQMPGQNADASYVVNMRNGRDGNATRLVADLESTLLTFLSAWKEMFDAGAVLDVPDSSLNNLFLTQQTVFLTASTSQLASLLNQIDGRFELGCTFFPRVSDKSNFGATVSGSALFMFDKEDKAKTLAAWEFLKFMTSSSIQARFAAATGYMPVNIDSVNETVFTDYVRQYPQAETGARQLGLTSPDMMGIIVGPSRSFYMEIINQVSIMLNSGRSPQESAVNMAASLNLLLDDYAQANR